MKTRIGQGQHSDDHGDGQVAPVASRQNLAPDDRGHGEQEQAVDHGGPGCRGDIRIQRHGQHGGPSRHPQAEQQGERQPDHGQSAGPVGHGGEQKPDDDPGGVAEQHLMHMPAQCYRSAIEEGVDPEWRGDRGPQGGEQKEGAKADTEDGGAAIGPDGGGCAHDGFRGGDGSRIGDLGEGGLDGCPAALWPRSRGRCGAAGLSNSACCARADCSSNSRQTGMAIASSRPKCRAATRTRPRMAAILCGSRTPSGSRLRRAMCAT